MVGAVGCKQEGALVPAIRYKSSPPLADVGFSLLSGSSSSLVFQLGNNASATIFSQFFFMDMFREHNYTKTFP
jgi:hypothetical protein